MTIQELIAALQKHSLDAKVMIHDADTGWALPIKGVDYGPYGQQRDLKTDKLDQTIYIWGEYHHGE